MGLADIKEKQGGERKREKRLVHFINAVTRDFQNVKPVNKKTNAYKNNAEYVTKSFLDYLFFDEHKEIRELNDSHVHHFMLEHAPGKLSFTPTTSKDVSEILSNFLKFLETEGHIHNGIELSVLPKKNNRTFLKLISKNKAAAQPKAKAAKKITPKKFAPVGRNDPCPCGSGKKYKKCCGRLT
jgi:uncharacterized protein YchJ